MPSISANDKSSSTTRTRGFMTPSWHLGEQFADYTTPVRVYRIAVSTCGLSTPPGRPTISRVAGPIADPRQALVYANTVQLGARAV
jgi:hypothetical protein